MATINGLALPTCQELNKTHRIDLTGESTVSLANVTAAVVVLYIDRAITISAINESVTKIYVKCTYDIFTQSSLQRGWNIGFVSLTGYTEQNFTYQISSNLSVIYATGTYLINHVSKTISCMRTAITTQTSFGGEINYIIY